MCEEITIETKHGLSQNFFSLWVAAPVAAAMTAFFGVGDKSGWGQAQAAR